MTHRYTPLAVALLSTLSLPATAETPEATAPAGTSSEITVTGSALGDERSYTPVTATVGGRQPADLRDTPQSVTVVNAAVLDDQAATSLVEALRNVPGITLSAGEGGNIGDNINLRGFSARTDIFLDGFRDRGQYTRDIFALDAVEVLKGPSSLFFGRGSTGGVIHQVSKRPDLEDRSEISASVGSDDYYRATFDANRKLAGKAAVRVAAFWQDIGFDRDSTEKQNFGIAPSLRLGIGQPTEVTVSALVQRNREVPDYGGPLLRASAGGTATPLEIGKHFYGFSDDHFDQDIDVVTIGIRHKLNDHLTLRNQTQYSQVKTDAAPTPLGTVSVVAGACQTQYGSTPYRTIPLGCLQAQRQDRDRDISDSALYNLTDLVARFATGAVRHTLTTGFEVGQDDHDFARYFWSPTNTAVNLGTPVTAPRPGSANLGQRTTTEATTLAVYANDQLDLTAQWKLVAGLRWDHFRARTGNTLYPAYTGTAPSPGLSSVDEMLSTRGGVLYQPSPAQSYYLSYGTSFNPSSEAITQANGTVDLEPEENRSWEIGGKWALAEEAVLLNAALFRVEKAHARTGAAPNTTLDGEIRVEGVEASITGQLNPDWQVIAGYTFLASEVLAAQDIGTGISAGVASQGKDYQNTPRHSATLWSTWRVTPQWQVGAGATGASSRYVNNFETAAIDGYVRGDAMVAFLQPAWDLRLNLQNLTDETYYETGSAGRGTAAMGRRAILTGSYRF